MSARMRIDVLVGEAAGPWREAALAALAEVAEVASRTVAGDDLVIELPATFAAGPGRLVIRDEDGLGPADLGAAALLAGRDAVVIRVIHIAADGAATSLVEGALGLRRRWRHAAACGYLQASVAAWPARVLAGQVAVRPPQAPDPVIAAPPPDRLRLRAAEAAALVRRIASEALEEQWAIGVVEAPAASLVHGLDGREVRWLPPPEGGFLADPMALPDTPGTLLAEAFWFRERRGKIVALDWGPEPAASRLVLERPWHFSYPFLFRHAGEVWCLPEMWEAGRIQLFRADRFPDRWEEGPVLIDGLPAVDATLHHDGERFWLFCGDQRDEPDARLFLFHAATLAGPWRAHPWNPVRCDLRGSRPAGPLFHDGDCLWRPAQDCSATYGGAVILNRVLELSPERFREEPAARLAPDPSGPYPDGLHTFCAAGPVTFIDGKRHVPAPGRLLASAGAILRKGWRRARSARLPAG